MNWIGNLIELRTNWLYWPFYFIFSRASSFFDLDEGPETRESLCIDEDQYHDYHVTDVDPEMIIRSSPARCSGEAGTDSIVFESSRQGFVCDNPEDPLNLGLVACEECPESCTVGGSNSEYFPIDRGKRSVEFVFRGRSSFRVTFATMASESGLTGRNILFASRSALSGCPDPTLAPTFSPTRPSPLPTIAPTDLPTSTARPTANAEVDVRLFGSAILVGPGAASLVKDSPSAFVSSLSVVTGLDSAKIANLELIVGTERRLEADFLLDANSLGPERQGRFSGSLTERRLDEEAKVPSAILEFLVYAAPARWGYSSVLNLLDGLNVLIDISEDR